MAACEKDWIDITQGLLVPVIALLGAWIAWQQWSTNRLRLQHEVFDRRFVLYEQILDLFGSVTGRSSFNSFDDQLFLEVMLLSKFLFGKDIYEFLEEARQKIADLGALEEERKGLEEGNQLTTLRERVLDIRRWFREELSTIDDRFDKYMSLAPAPLHQRLQKGLTALRQHLPIWLASLRGWIKDIWQRVRRG